jgi:hypothetical protein
MYTNMETVDTIKNVKKNYEKRKKKFKSQILFFYL